MDSDVLFWDMETNGLLPELTEIHCIAFAGDHQVQSCNDQNDKAPQIGAALVCLENWGTIVGHNIIGFDIPAVQKMYPGWEPSGQVIDTLVWSRLMYPNMDQIDWSLGDRCKVPKTLRGRHSLEAWGYRLGCLKGDYAETTEDAWARWSQEMEDYCIQDVVVTRELYRHLIERGVLEVSDAWQMEMSFQDVISHQERNGFTFDIPLAQRLYARLSRKRDALMGTLQETFPPILGELLGAYKNQEPRMHRLLESWEVDPDAWKEQAVRTKLEENGIKFKWTKKEIFNPNSGDQIAHRMKAKGWIPRVMTPTGKPSVEEDVLVEMAKNFEEAGPLAEYSLLTKRLGQIGDGANAWLKMVGEDGRMHGRVNTMGTITYRCSHHSPNIGQVPAVGALYGEECRRLFRVTEGYDLVGCDVAGLELRMLAHYMASWDGGSYANEIVEGDIHTANQEAAGLATRTQAKTFIYAFLYGAGDAKLGSIAGGGVRMGKSLRRRFLQRTPALKQLTEAVRVKAARSKKLVGLDGRMLHVRSPHSALNCLLQAGGSILTKKATVIFADKLEAIGLSRGSDWSLVAHVHDEWQTECRQEYTPIVQTTAVEAIEEAGRYYKLQCPFTGETKVGSNWAETH